MAVTKCIISIIITIEVNNIVNYSNISDNENNNIVSNNVVNRLIGENRH